MLVSKFEENGSTFFIDSDYLVESIRMAYKVEDNYLNEHFKDSNYEFNYLGYELAILTELGVCLFKAANQGIKSYTVNRPMYLLTNQEKQLISKYCPEYADTIRN